MAQRGRHSKTTYLSKPISSNPCQTHAKSTVYFLVLLVPEQLLLRFFTSVQESCNRACFSKAKLLFIFIFLYGITNKLMIWELKGPKGPQAWVLSNFLLLPPFLIHTLHCAPNNIKEVRRVYGKFVLYGYEWTFWQRGSIYPHMYTQ